MNGSRFFGQKIYLCPASKANLLPTATSNTKVLNLNPKMKQLKQVLLAAAILVLTSFSALAQSGIKGNVKDKETGEPLPFMSVYVNGKTIGTMTDFDGNYTLNLDPGTYEIVFSSVEHGKSNKSVTITAGAVQTIDMEIVKNEIMTGQV